MQVNLPDNIQKYQLKQVGGLTKRQAAHLALAVVLFAAMAAAALLWMPGGIAGKTVGVLLAALLCVPVLVAGFWSYMGLSAGDVFRRWRRQAAGKDYRPYRREGMSYYHG